MDEEINDIVTVVQMTTSKSKLIAFPSVVYFFTFPPSTVSEIIKAIASREECEKAIEDLKTNCINSLHNAICESIYMLFGAQKTVSHIWILRNYARRFGVISEKTLSKREFSLIILMASLTIAIAWFH